MRRITPSQPFVIPSCLWLGCLFLAVLPSALDASSTNTLALIRGPYLQNVNQTNITVKWRTSLPTDTRVYYGQEPSTLEFTYQADAPVTNHSARLTGLLPGTTYYYQIATSTNSLSNGPDHYFRTIPADIEPIRIWAIGDSGTASVGAFGSHQVRDAYMAYPGYEDTDVWLMLGDNAYFQGTDRQFQVAVFDTYTQMLRHKVPWSTIGNHETYATDTNGFFAYLAIYDHPRQGEAGGLASGSPYYYSFDYANTHFVCLDSEVLRGTNEVMVSWLEQDLAATTKPWIIAYWHSPPYTKGSHNSDSRFDSAGGLFIMRTNIVPILESYGVDLVLCGHSHNYERSYLIDGHYGTSDTLQPEMILDPGSGRPEETGAYRKSSQRAGHQGTVYVVAGSSGWATFTTGRHPVMHTQLLEIGSLVIDIDGPRLDAKFLRETGEIEDSFTIVKGDQPRPFRIVEYLKPAVTNNVVVWSSDPGKTYEVQATDSLTNRNWVALSPLITATGHTTYWTNTTQTAPPSRYYRVEEKQ